MVDTEDLKTVPPSEIHVKRFKSKEVDTTRETTNLYSHAGRAESGKKDSSYPPLCTERRGDFRQLFQEEPSEEGETRDPSPDLEIRQDFRNSTRTCKGLSVHIRCRFTCAIKNASPRVHKIQELTIDDYWNMDGDKSLSEP